MYILKTTRHCHMNYTVEVDIYISNESRFNLKRRPTDRWIAQYKILFSLSLFRRLHIPPVPADCQSDTFQVPSGFMGSLMGHKYIKQLDPINRNYF